MRTIDVVGVETKHLRISKQYVLKIFGADRRWHRFKNIDERGSKIGSGMRSERFPEGRFLADRHFRLKPDGATLLIEDLGSLNGTFRMIKQEKALSHGTRFRIGPYLVEFRLREPLPAPAPASEDGEEFWCLDLAAPASLVFIRPDGRSGLEFPLTKTISVLGQDRDGESSSADIHLPADMTSGRHARIIHRDRLFVLENLSKTIGTFVQVTGTEPIGKGDVILAGQVKFMVDVQDE